MNLALYRKYRPSTFLEVLGQDNVISLLKVAVEKDNPAHAYIFSGSRGVGKTSIARILANELKVSSSDIYEIDAASNRGIDDIRELRDSVYTLPFESKYKVYIIDEVHMLTKEAWNALLKTLEEPPKHVIFMLATTEVSKIPETIISRCENYTLKRPTEKVLRGALSFVAKEEKLKISEGGIELISILADGSFRDAYGILQKVENYSSDKIIERSEIEQITGAPSQELVEGYIRAFVLGDVEEGILIVEKAEDNGVDMKIFGKLIVLLFRQILLAKFAQTESKVFMGKLTERELKFVDDIKNIKSLALTSSALKELLSAYDEINNSFVPGLPLELAIIKIKEVYSSIK